MRPPRTARALALQAVALALFLAVTGAPRTARAACAEDADCPACFACTDAVCVPGDADPLGRCVNPNDCHHGSCVQQGACVANTACPICFNCALLQCQPSSMSDPNCAAPARCVRGSCVLRTGSPCTGAARCDFACVDDFCCDTTCFGACRACDTAGALGTCSPTPGVEDPACGPYRCGAVNCLTSCGTSADCAASAFCSGGQCVPRLADGQACTTPGDCASGHCADGLCCNQACTGQCEACDTAGAAGQCVPVMGAPVGARPGCARGSAAAPCTARVCDGATRTACTGFVGAAVECAPPRCSAGQATPAAGCNGTGACATPTATDCAPYTCAGDRCAVEPCNVDAACADAFRCDPALRRCVPRDQSVCISDFALTDPSGAEIDCSPYRCLAGACRDRCETSADCAAGTVCNADLCVAATAGPPATSEADSGCACHAPRSRPGAAWALGLGVFLGLVRRERARRR